jgi:hypothetical protein
MIQDIHELVILLSKKNNLTIDEYTRGINDMNLLNENSLISYSAYYFFATKKDIVTIDDILNYKVVTSSSTNKKFSSTDNNLSVIKDYCAVNQSLKECICYTSTKQQLDTYKIIYEKNQADVDAIKKSNDLARTEYAALKLIETNRINGLVVGWKNEFSRTSCAKAWDVCSGEFSQKDTSVGCKFNCVNLGFLGTACTDGYQDICRRSQITIDEKKKQAIDIWISNNSPPVDLQFPAPPSLSNISNCCVNVIEATTTDLKNVQQSCTQSITSIINQPIVVPVVEEKADTVSTSNKEEIEETVSPSKEEKDNNNIIYGILILLLLLFIFCIIGFSFFFLLE